MALQPDSVFRSKVAVAGDVHQRLPLAWLVVAEPTDRGDRVASRATLANTALHAIGKHAVHDLPWVVLAAVERFAVIAPQNSANASPKVYDLSREGRQRLGGGQGSRHKRR